MVDLEEDAHQYRLDEIRELKKQYSLLNNVLGKTIADKIAQEINYVTEIEQLTERNKQLEATQGRLIEALRVNMIRYADAYVSHEDIDALIRAALREKKDE